MMNTSKKPAYNVTPGTIIEGKWHRKSYFVVKSLGYGATGSVYLVKGREGLVALKISDDSMAITSEVNVLRHFSKVQGCLGPSLLDVDDWVLPGGRIVLPFYVMEYLKGLDFLSFIKKNGQEWLGVLVLQLLSDLEQLHQAGWVFGDLKPDNLLVVGPPPKVRLLDVGGTTIKGRSIKEFTEFYDRGYWNLGSRKAEPSYDLFAVAMIILNTAYPHRFSKKGEVGDYYSQLVRAIQTASSLRKYENVMVKAIKGRYLSAREMRSDLIVAISPQYNRNKAVAPPVNKKINYSKFIPKQEVIPKSTRNKFKGVIETIIIAVFLLVAYFLYIAGQIM
ncbi:MAG TPA: protein kinase family protein [Bacillus bacterium]|nr:protein kinase family protein [Bacillus sp. (in: firmicutes)]